MYLLHVLCILSYSAGNVRVIEAVFASPSFKPTTFVDGKGQTLIHLVVKAQVKRKISSAVLNVLLQKNIIDPTLPDRAGKRPLEYLQQGDQRRPILEKGIQEFHLRSATPSDKSHKGKGKKASASLTAQRSESHSRQSSTPLQKQQKRTQSKTPKEDSQPSPQNVLSMLLEKVLARPPDYFREDIPQPTQQFQRVSLVRKGDSSSYSAIVHDGVAVNSISTHDATEPKLTNARPVDPVDRRSRPAQFPAVTCEAEDAVENATSLFEGLTWEVEVTNAVRKFFDDKKHNPPELRKKAVTTIYELAEGKRNDRLSKPVSKPNEDCGLHLYEAKISKASRILWEKAIQFSARQTESCTDPVYCQIVRVWSVVLDHDQLHRCIEQIKISHRRGQSASNRLTLLPRKMGGTKPASTELFWGRETLDIPVSFQVDWSASSSEEEFVPAASLKEDEFNITTFYNCSTALVKSMFMDENMRRHFEFPFKEWPQEHEIITLPFGAKTILLLGRSGTGKTTCCFYRLWNEFKIYWDPQFRHPDLRIPRKPLLSLPPEEVNQSASEESDGESTLECSSDSPDHPNASSKAPPTEVSDLPTLDSCKAAEVDHKQSSFSTEPKASVDEQNVPGPSIEEEVDICPKSECESLDDLHQVFITKNYVLCSQMKRRFYDMAAPYDYLGSHMEFENRKLSNSLLQIADLVYPLFLTAREFYILLDNSLLEDVQAKFFPRDSEGNPEVKIISADYDHEDQDIPLDLESDSEDEDAPEVGGLHNKIEEAAPASKSLRKYVEVTSLYFKDKVWNHIEPCDRKGIDPILAWMEIQSYIKGSEGALRKGTPLSREEYRQLGGKAAANYVEHRDQVYTIFEQYHKYRQNLRHTTFLFDECDLVLSLHKRICTARDVPWSIHCFYVDEVQDFTQAELALFLQCCRDPNSIFFTGDTAQSIMRGIAFRFEDVQSMFHRIHVHEPKVKVPERPYTLTVNFRSHSGILGLAQSVLDLLLEYFKGSLDSHLPEDKGMLPGPKPVLLESCRVEDLALLLSTNKREKSSIEFGAHQVILVRSKESRDHLPEILKGAIVLTIFESKGLEFDDVLLYNFFQDSEVRNTVTILHMPGLCTIAHTLTYGS